jgi:hypothetical protein
MGGWTPGIGDPTIYGWISVVAYAAAAILCWRAQHSAAPGERRLWLAIAIVLAALAINKQLDLQSLLTATGRSIAKAHHWYRDRRAMQVAFIGALVAAGAVGAFALCRTYNRVGPPLVAALAGTGVLFLFILIRASSFYKVDILINKSLGGVRANHAIELAGISIVAISAIFTMRSQSRASART